MTQLRRRLASEDEGAVLMSVIAVAAVVMIVCVLLATTTINAATYSSVTRAALQSAASADAGIDIVWSSMENSNFLCSSSVNQSGLHYEVTNEYYDENDNLLTCSGTSALSGTPVRAVITSTGIAAQAGVGSATRGNERTIISLVDIEVNNNEALLDKVFFSDGSYTITNSTDVLDASGLTRANLYSNNNIDCTTTVALQGSVFVQGNFSAHNKCVISGTVWAGGAVTSDDQLLVSGDVLSMGGTGATPTDVSLDKAWIGGSVVANGNITAGGTANSQYCSIAGYQAKVCGNVVSILGSISLSNGASIVGNAMALNAVDIGTTNNNLIVGGNVISTKGGLLANNTGNKGFRVGGYIAIKGSSQVPKERIGNQVASCATLTTGLTACNPAEPVRSLDGLPTLLNFPTNETVLAPPRESLARVNGDSTGFALWGADGWSIETIGCSAVKGRIQSGWTGKLLLNVTGCATPYQWDNETFTLTGDLALFIPAGIDAKNDLTFGSNNTTKRTLHLIVPSDALLADGTTPLVTWSNPLPLTDPNYSTPTCAAGTYGDIRSSKITTTNVNTFIYTPCDFYVANQLLNFYGQIYSGNSTYPNNSSITYLPIDVPGAVVATAISGPPVTVTETYRFDARG